MPVQKCLMKHFQHKAKEWKKGLNKVKTIYLREMQKGMCMWVLILWPQVCPRCHPVVDSLVKHPKSCPRPYLCAVQSCGSADPNRSQELLLHITRKTFFQNFQIHTTANQLRIHFFIPEERDIPLWEDTFCQQSPGSHTGDPKSHSHRKLPMRIQSAKLHITELQLITIRSL
jgi:hypothetical protein